MKDEAGVKFYLRYMDDFIILGPDKDWLRDRLRSIEEKLAIDLKLALNPKTAIFPVHRGVDFAGYRTWATHILPRKRNTTRMRRQLMRMARLYTLGRASLEDVSARVASFIGYMRHCSGRTTARSILRDLVLSRDNRVFREADSPPDNGLLAPRRWRQHE